MSAFERLLPHPSFARLHDDRRDVRLRSGADIFRTSTDVCFIGWSTGCIQESLGSVISIDRGSTVPAAAALSASTAATSITNRMLSASDPLMINSDATRSGTPKPGVSIGVRLLLRALFLRRCFFDLCDSLSTVLAGKRSDIYSWDLIQSVPEPRSLESPKPGVSIGVRLLLRALFLRRGFFDLCDSQALSPLWACRRRTHTTMTTRMKMTKRMTTRKTKSPQSSENRTNSSRAIASNELNAD